MKRLKKILAVALCCLVLCFDAGSSYVYAADVSPAYSRGQLAWDGVAWALLSALGIATGEATGAVDYLTDNVWTPLVAHLKEKWGSMCDVFIDKTNNKSYVSKDMMQDALDWGINNKLWSLEGTVPNSQIESTNGDSIKISDYYSIDEFLKHINGKQILKDVDVNSNIFSYSNFVKTCKQKGINLENYSVCLQVAGSQYCFWYLFKLPDSYYMSYIYKGNSKDLNINIYDKDSGDAKSIEYGSFLTNWNGSPYSNFTVGHTSGIRVSAYDYTRINMGVYSEPKDYAIDSGLTVPKAGEKIDDWLAAQDKVNGGSVGLLGNDVAIPSDVTGTGAAIDSLPLTIPSFADLVINGQLSIDDVLSQGLVKANSGAIADTQSAAGAVAGAEDVAATGENAEANAISVDQAQAALKNLMQQGLDYIAIEIPNNFWNKIPFSIPYDIYLLIHGIFVGSSGGSKKAARREASSGSNMPVGDPSNVGIEIDIPTVPLKYTEENTEDTPPNFTFTLNIPYTTPSGQTANFNKEFTIETAKYNYFAKIIKFSIGLLWLSSVFQWLLAIFSKG